MSGKLSLEFNSRPSVLAYMLRGFYPSPGLGRTGGVFPPMRASWRQHRIDERHLAGFSRLTGLRAGENLPMLYPHVFTFPLLMALLTYPSFPLGLWNALQVRNHLLQHRPIPRNARLDIETRVAGQRILEKGAEADLHTTVRMRSELVWESVNTFYYRGRYGAAQEAAPLSRSPVTGDEAIARWHMGRNEGWRCGGLTGDYNGIHVWNWYARMFGFRGAFHHPQFVTGQCLSRLPALEEGRPQRLDAWLKGPVYYGSHVRLLSDAPGGNGEGDGHVFGIVTDRDERPAIVGRWRNADEGRGLLASLQ